MSKKFVSVIFIVILTVTLILGRDMFHVISSAGLDVSLSVNPEFLSVEPNRVFTVNISIANVENLFKWSLSVSWDPAVIELDPASVSAVTEGDFLKNAGLTLFRVATYTVGSGCLSFISCELIQPTSVSGNGTLLTLHFRAVNDGETDIVIGNSVLYNFNRQKISHTCSSGHISVKSVTHDVVVKLEAPSRLILGSSALLNATVENVGDVDEENVNLAILINGTVRKLKIVPLLKVGDSHKLSLSWTPSSKGIFNITAYATPIPGETKISDNVNIAVVEVVSLVHDVAVLLECPTRNVLGEPIMLNVTITNVGSFNEVNVKVSIIINGAVENSSLISQLESGSSQQIIYLWKPAHKGTYNVTVYVEPVAEENNTINNKESKFVKVVDSLAQPRILIVADDDGLYCYRGTSLDEFEHILRLEGYNYDVWIESKEGRPSLNTLLNYELIIWTSGDYSWKSIDKIDAYTLEEYLNQGGNILIEGENIAIEHPPEYSNMRKGVLHVNYLGYYPGSAVSGIRISMNCAITKGLSPETPWEITPHYLPKVLPIEGAYEALSFFSDQLNANTTAVNIFDGTQNGRGSVIYFAFSLFNLPKLARNQLVVNSIEWLLRFGVSTVGSQMVYAPPNSVYFIYTDPKFLTVNGTFDIVAGATIYGLCKNPQKQGFNTTQNWFLKSGKINYTEINNAIIVLLGTPDRNSVVRYYENANLTPVKFYENSTHFLLMDQTQNVLLSISKGDVQNGIKDAFVVYVFRDGSNKFLVVYGFGWRGTWAAGTFFKDEIAKQFPVYSENFYVFLLDKDYVVSVDAER